MTDLLLDLDAKRIPPTFYPRLAHCLRLWDWPFQGMRYDRTRRGWHVTVRIGRTIPPALVVAAQAILGSDPAREAFNAMRVQSAPKGFWGERWNVLYAAHSRKVKLDT